MHLTNAMPSFPLLGLPLLINRCRLCRPHQKIVAEFTVAEFSGCPVFRCPVYRLPPIDLTDTRRRRTEQLIDDL